MKTEILDLYDDNFNKLDKTIVRRVDEIPDGANIMQCYILINNNGKYLLEQATARNDFKWAVPGGHMSSGETPEESLKRELEEELGLTNVEFVKLDTVKFPYNKYIFNVFYSDTLIDLDTLRFQPEEVTQVKWFTKEEILKLIEEEKIPRGYAFVLKNYMK